VDLSIVRKQRRKMKRSRDMLQRCEDERKGFSRRERGKEERIIVMIEMVIVL